MEDRWRSGLGWGVFSMEKRDVLRYNYCVKYIYETLYNTHKI